MSTHFDQGSDDDHHPNYHEHSHIPSRFTVKDKPLAILSSTKHSLEPDMVFGWRPKLPSCPLPLKFPNPQTEALLPLINNSDVYRMAYRSKHFVSSVQVNQKYDYYWKYRSRYSLNLALIGQAAKQQSIGSPSHQSVKCQTCEYSFSSQFESGNLDFAVRVKPNEYDCFMKSDSNTKGHCNWYFFSVKNHDRIGSIKINVCNIGKIKNLYNKGMKPYVRESNHGFGRESNQGLAGESKQGVEKEQNQENVYKISQGLDQNEQAWSQQLCYDVQFVERICRYGSEKKRFQLQFKYDFSQPQQEVFFAYAIPYTYSKLERFIKRVSTPLNKDILTVEKLCESLGGLNIPLLKITNNASTETQIEPTKKAVLLSARIHPGESHSSHVMQGVIMQLLKQEPQHQILREMFVFYIVPMINVDGVVIGNYRTSYSGKDLNRQFKNLDTFVFPQITRLHQFALQIRQKHFNGVEFYLDFHGHSSKKNLFAYGPDHTPNNIYFFKSRIFAKLIEDFHPIFSYKKSIFKISEGKKKTARAHMLWKLKIPMVYTFEVSNGMYETKNKENILLTEQILLDAGAAVMKGFFKYVKLEMRIPARLMQNKAQKENIKKRIIRSSKGIRDSSIGIKRKSSKLNDIGNLEYTSEKVMIEKKMRIHSRNETGRGLELEDRPEEMNEETQENLEEFMELLEQVKNTKLEEEIEGGSDSESDGEDMDGEEVEKLFKGIKNRKLLKELKDPSKKRKVGKSRQKKAAVEEKSIFSQIKKELKRYKNSELEELIKESKKLSSQMSYMTLPLGKQSLAKSPSMNQKMMKMGTRVYNIVGGSRENCQVEKVLKAPIAQRSFNLQI